MEEESRPLVLDVVFHQIGNGAISTVVYGNLHTQRVSYNHVELVELLISQNADLQQRTTEVKPTTFYCYVHQ